MNKKLSRLISMVLAMVMTLSCFVCSSVEALAADQSTNVTYTLSQDGTTATWKFDKAPSSNVSISANDTLSGIVAKTATSIKNSTGYLGLNKGSEILVPVPAGSAGNIAVTSNRTDKARTIGFGTTTITQSSSANSASFVSSDITTVDGSSYLDLTVAGGEYQITEISITLTTGSYNTGGDVDSGPFDCTINVTNDASTDATIVINDNNFKTTANSSESHTISLDNGNYAITLLSGTEDTYTLVDSEGKANPSLTVDGSAASINVTIKDKYFTAYVNVANSTDKDLEVKLVGNDGTETTAQTVAANSLSIEYSFTKLNAYDANGDEIVYTVYVGDKEVGTVQYSNATLSNINITTTTATESTSETTTEATTKTEATEATTASAGSVYNHNFETDGTSSEFYAISGSLATNKGSVTYNGTTINQCLKMESSTSIKFTGSGTLTLVFGTTETNKAVKVDGQTYTTDGSGIVTIKLASGTHNITKGDSINLFYMSFVEGDVVIETTTQATTATATEATTKSEGTTEATTVDLSKNVVVYNSVGTAIGSYDTIQAAVNAETTVENCVIQVKPGNYAEQVKIPATVKVNKKEISKKGITIKKAEGETGEVIIYDAGAGGSYNPVVSISADNVSMSNITILNTSASEYEGIASKNSESGNTAALETNGNNGKYDNIKLIGSQDTIVISSTDSTRTNTFNNSTFIGATDFVAGAGIVTFNNCNFIFDSGTRNKLQGYVFALVYGSNWTVNGGSITRQEDSITPYYARFWLNSSYKATKTAPTLNIYDIKCDLAMGTEGILGFQGTTGATGTTDTTDDKYDKEKDNNNKLLNCDFNVYDSNNKLIATTNTSELSKLIQMNSTNNVIKFKDGTKALLVADYGIADNQTLTNNTLADANAYGFVIFDDESLATATNAETVISKGTKNVDYILSTAVYNNIKTEEGTTNELEKGLTSANAGQYFGVGRIDEIPEGTNTTVYVIPFVAIDTQFKRSGVEYDTNKTYIFGNVTAVNLDNSTN